jgi:hypothetical protein
MVVPPLVDRPLALVLGAERAVERMCERSAAGNKSNVPPPPLYHHDHATKLVCTRCIIGQILKECLESLMFGMESLRMFGILVKNVWNP